MITPALTYSETSDVVYSVTPAVTTAKETANRVTQTGVALIHRPPMDNYHSLAITQVYNLNLPCPPARSTALCAATNPSERNAAITNRLAVTVSQKLLAALPPSNPILDKLPVRNTAPCNVRPHTTTQH